MKLEITDAEAAVIDAGLVQIADAYGRLAYVLRGKKSRYRNTVNERVEIAGRLRRKLLVSKYGETRAAEIVAEREAVPTAEELYNGVPARERGAAQGVIA